MTIDKRINAFAALGEKILSEYKPESNSNLSIVIENAHIHNPWFTPSNVRSSLTAIAQQWLSRETLQAWLSNYPPSKLNNQPSKHIGVIMAGNIPLVGFHDFLCVLVSGHHFAGKTSSKDGNLMLTIAQMLTTIDPEFQNYIEITDNQLKGFDAIIATGSDNTSRYFDFYFRNYPSIIRKHRNSVAIITGDESNDDFLKLGDDIFSYFGLGCRNVSKLLVPKGYCFIPMLDCFAEWSHLINNSKYANNYEYNRAMYIMNQAHHLDTGFLIVSPSDSIESPVGTLFYQEYNSLAEVNNYISKNSEKIQCVVGGKHTHKEAIPFGTAQTPAISEYADGVDTINFLLNL